ncbi:LytTR family transcriptional regulator [Latilactobacillus graminis]|uniref:LytTR family transcriptional regulator n=1 Tax=Latilactobacillus graminis TaxID=60519 RepID=A0ABX6CAB4_9LACO|nr:LytTR family DNA-binding domain-containing protein [Latilactobacillus graminis]QFP80130.1 LytTR family transcriptional regulator [Latilactobacillus graminis]
MKVNFEQNEQLADDDIRVTVQAAHLSQTVIELIQALEARQQSVDVYPITVDERVVLVPITDIIALEVYGTDVTLYTIEATYKIRGVLKKILGKLNQQDFIQIAKGSAINLNHLQSLEAAFSGSMTAFLSNQLKLTVSRKYLPELRQQLRM